jgi:Transposase DDE domain
MEDWEIVKSLLPTDWEESARQCGAFRRHRKVDSAETLLRLILLHVAGELSVHQTVVRARHLGWAELTDMALLKRLRHSAGWLEYLCERLRSRPCWPEKVEPGKRRWRIVDATTVEEPGATQTSWRLHYVIQLPCLACDYVSVTDAHGGETLCRIPIRAGDVIIADQGYSQRAGVDWVLSEGGHVIVRLQGTNFPLLDQQGCGLELLPALRTLQQHLPGTWELQFETRSHRRWPVWLHAVRKSEEAAQRAKKRSRQERGRSLQPSTLELAEYIMVLTSLPPTELPGEPVLGLYRGRWQIELVFKILKSLLGVGDLAMYDEDSARAWLQAKLLVALLIERLEREAGLFATEDPGCWELLSWRQYRETKDSIKAVIAPALPLPQLLEEGRQIGRGLQQRHRRRRRQMESLVSIIENK